jgi:hypothetical protein
MKNKENAESPTSAIVYVTTPQPRLSAKPLQTVRNPANCSSKISMPQKITPQGPCQESTSVHHLELLQVRLEGDIPP